MPSGPRSGHSRDPPRIWDDAEACVRLRPSPGSRPRRILLLRACNLDYPGGAGPRVVRAAPRRSRRLSRCYGASVASTSSPMSSSEPSVASASSSFIGIGGSILRRVVRAAHLVRLAAAARAGRDRHGHGAARLLLVQALRGARRRRGLRRRRGEIPVGEHLLQCGRRRLLVPVREAPLHASLDRRSVDHSESARPSCSIITSSSAVPDLHAPEEGAGAAAQLCAPREATELPVGRRVATEALGHFGTTAGRRAQGQLERKKTIYYLILHGVED